MVETNALRERVVEPGEPEENWRTLTDVPGEFSG
jgi:hypothetical protein